jgi:hypothetical protein
VQFGSQRLNLRATSWKEGRRGSFDRQSKITDRVTPSPGLLSQLLCHGLKRDGVLLFDTAGAEIIDSNAPRSLKSVSVVSGLCHVVSSASRRSTATIMAEVLIATGSIM